MKRLDYWRSYWSAMQSQLPRHIERFGELVAIALIAIVLITLAAMLTPLVVYLVQLIPAGIGRVIGLLQRAWNQPWEHWLAFPFVLTALGVAAWYLIQSEYPKDSRPIRGRKVLSAEEARKAALRQLRLPGNQRRFLKKP